jgi:hypothetical protein
MKRILILLLLGINICHAQTWQADISVGGAGYSGDLAKHDISLKTIKPGFGLNVRYGLSDRVTIRAGFNYGKIGADDKNSSDSADKARNLNFQTNILEGSLAVEVNLLSSEYFDLYPYVFAGVGYFHFNPYTIDGNGQKVYLKPLSTEGEGLAQFPDRKPYSLNQFCIPFGVGVKKRLGEQFDIAFELGVRKIFTDYLDDVSKRYVDYNTLLVTKGQETVQLAYRGAGNYPHPNAIRGNSNKSDLYYMFGLKLIYYLGGRPAGYGGTQPEYYRR